MIKVLDIKAKVVKAFNNIGRTNGTVSPDPSSNTFGLVWEYYVADILSGLAKKRKEQAQAACQSAGLIGNNDKFTEGNTELLYDSDQLTISARTATAAERIDPTALGNALTRELGAAKSAKILQEATKKNNPATTYIFAVK